MTHLKRLVEASLALILGSAQTTPPGWRWTQGSIAMLLVDPSGRVAAEVQTFPLPPPFSVYVGIDRFGDYATLKEAQRAAEKFLFEDKP